MDHPDNRPSLDYSDVCMLLAGFIVFRAAAIIALYLISGGQELASDVVFHELIIKYPLGILQGTAIHIASYPPFQWLIEWSVFNLYNQYFGDMISYRMLMVSVEFCAFVLAIVVCMKIRLSKTLSYTVLILFIIGPHQSFSSVFFIQEDVIAQLFMLMALFFILDDKRNYCIATLVLGVLIAKLFFVLPLFYIVLFQGERLFFKRVLDGTLALLPLVIVYVFIILQALHNGGEIPIKDFTPDAKYAANYWVLLIKSDPALLVLYKNYSLMLTALVQFGIAVYLLHRQYLMKRAFHPVVLMVIPLGIFFATFYQHMPEYLLMLWPIGALLCSSLWQHIIFTVALSFAWLPRITHGLTTVVDNFGTAAQARSDVVGPLVRFFDLDYVLINKIALVAQSLVYTILILWLCWLCKPLQRQFQNQ